MYLSFPVAAATIVLTIILIIWLYFGIKSKKFTFEEIEIGKIKINELEKNDVLCTSPYFSIRNLGIIRLICAIWASSILLAAVIDSSERKPAIPLLAWYTVWNWLLLWLYFVLSTILTFLTNCGYKCCCNCIKNNHKIINKIRIISYIIFAMECGLVLLVDLVVWCLLYPLANQHQRDVALLPFCPLMMHTSNFLLIYFELIINNVPLANFHHAIFSMMLPLIYCIFEWFLNIFYGIYFAYPFVDPGNVWNAAMYIIIFGVHLLCWTVAYKFQKVIVRQKIRKNATNSNLAGQYMLQNVAINSTDTNNITEIQTENT